MSAEEGMVFIMEFSFITLWIGLAGLLVELAEKYPGFGRVLDRVTGKIERFFAFIFGDEYQQHDNDDKER